ncbi:MAG: FecR family protein [Bacteroidetes bacterium]|nr:FecR family protein [Bacteroidota bacterium]
MEKKKLSHLLHLYVTGKCTLEEEKELARIVNQQDDKSLKDELNRIWDDNASPHSLSDDKSNQILSHVLESKLNAMPNEPWKNKKRLYLRIASVAASILIILGGFSFYLFQKSASFNIEQVVIAPGTNGAILTLADGKKIEFGNHVLTNMDEDSLAQISYYSDGLLQYKNIRHHVDQRVAYNTLTIPNGNKFALVLSDGTKVFLNAGSTLQYPEAFGGSERLVKLTGEAYFEVVHNSQSPFRVQVKNQIIEDIGTSFNVNAYTDEVFTTVTLVEGSVKVRNNESEVIITPGQKALTYDGNNSIAVQSANFESELAWRSDLFHFEDVQLSVVLKQIARWYDLEIEYEGTIPSKTINGEIYRNMNGAQILIILKRLGVDFELEGNKLTIKS